VIGRLPRPHALLGALCVGVAGANVARAPLLVVAAAAAGVAAVSRGASDGRARLALTGAALLLGGWCWGSLRADSLDRSVLIADVGRAEQTRATVTAPPRHGKFDLRVPVRVEWFGRLHADEPALLQLPLGRAPPQGTVIEAVVTVKRPRGPAHGFDERAWLRRQGVHVVLRASEWRRVGARGGLGGVADRLRVWLGRGSTTGLAGERRALVAGVVLGDDQGLSDTLRQRFRASGLYHLLAVSGQNVAYVAWGALAFAWLLGLPRLAGQLLALLGILGYVAAVGPQPSVIRAGVAGVVSVVAWLAARERDRWYTLLLAALVLLAWNPYLLLDAGFQLSFVAVTSIFTLAPRFRRVLDGYPIPGEAAEVAAISAACGVATAPVAWLQFHAVPLLTIPANLAAAPAVAPLLGLALVAALLAPFAPTASAALAWGAGWCGTYLATCARIVGSLPLAQIRSGRAVAAAGAAVLLIAAYACRRGERAEAGLPPYRERSPEDPYRAGTAPRPIRR
jgi:competence protein ComEC